MTGHAEVRSGTLAHGGSRVFGRRFPIRAPGRHHRSYVRPGVARPMVIPAHKDVPVFVIRNNLKTAGLSRDEYFRLLEQVK